VAASSTSSRMWKAIPFPLCLIVDQHVADRQHSTPGTTTRPRATHPLSREGQPPHPPDPQPTGIRRALPVWPRRKPGQPAQLPGST
jgi:hypothetical protein